MDELEKWVIQYEEEYFVMVWVIFQIIIILNGIGFQIFCLLLMYF